MLRKKTAVVLAAALAFSAAATGTVAATGQLPLLNRSAKGKVDEFGGAARLRGDQSRLIKESIKRSHARNVILFIGDGMGDSEITVARNYLEGAGDALQRQQGHRET
jgi:alkaline phosphatase